MSYVQYFQFKYMPTSKLDIHTHPDTQYLDFRYCGPVCNACKSVKCVTEFRDIKGRKRQVSYPPYANGAKNQLVTHAALRTLQINKYSTQHQEYNTSARKPHARSRCVKHEDGKQLVAIGYIPAT